jgi:hypothetical protein
MRLIRGRGSLCRVPAKISWFVTFNRQGLAVWKIAMRRPLKNS